ncbi:MAG: hypothetical protein ACE5HW_03850 [Candidatus Methanofastidiosia archaeon]
MNRDSDIGIEEIMKLKKEDSLFNFSLDVVKFDAFFEELEKDQLTGIVKITTPLTTMRIFLKKGKILKSFINDREASIFEIEKLKGSKGSISVYRINEGILNLIVLFSGAKPKETLSTEYADIRKYLQVKERDHFSGIVEFLEKGDRGFLRLDKGSPKDGIFISKERVSFFSEALSKIMDESRNFQIRSYDVKTLYSSDEITQEILSNTTFTVYHKMDTRKLLTEFENFTPENVEEIEKFQLHPHQRELYIIEDEGEVLGLEFVYETKEYRFLQWVLKDLFSGLAHKNVNSYKYLWYWIPECDTIEFFKEFNIGDELFTFDVVFKTNKGDLLMENPLGELLFVARFSEHVSRKDLQDFIEEVEKFKNSRIEMGDLGAVFLVARTFEKKALELAENLTKKSIADRLFKLKGFLRISREAGVHLILVKEDPFEMIFPK